MYEFPSLPAPDPRDVELLTTVQQWWGQGVLQLQENALQLLRERAEQGEGWAAALGSWLAMQQGSPEGYERSIDFAIQAAEYGFSGQLSMALNNTIGMIGSYPQLADRISDLVNAGAWWGAPGFDPIGQGWNALHSGQPQLAVQLMMLPTPLPLPVTDQQLSGMVHLAQARIKEINSLADTARQDGSNVAEASAEARDRLESESVTALATIEAASTDAQAAINQALVDLETRARQAGLLVSSTTSEATNVLYDAEAKRNTKESRSSWRLGLGVLGLAAVVAVLPVVLHYLHVGPKYSSFEQIALHLVSTAALASWAGVMLARARSRDQAAQRAHDLSTAMGTMISYSSQIRDDAERERFMTVMGQMILQAHLTTNSKSGGGDESLAGMLALMNMVKPTALPASST